MAVGTPTALVAYASTANVTTSGAVTTGAAVSVGTLLTVSICGGASGVTYGVSDSKGNTWAQLATINNATGAANTTDIWYTVVTVALTSSDTITVTRGTSGGLAWAAHTTSGVSAGGPFGTPVTAAAASASDPSCSQLTVPTNGAGLAVCGFANNTTITWGTGLTGAGAGATSSGSGNPRQVQVATATATVASPSGNLATNGGWGIIVVPINPPSDYSAAGTVAATTAVTGDVTVNSASSNYAAAGTVAATSGLSGAVTSNLVASASAAGVSGLTGAVTANRVASGTVAGVSGVRGKVPPQRPVTARWVILGDSTTYRSGTTSSPPSRESVTRAVFATVGFDDAKGYWYGVGGKRMLVADSGGKTTPTNITDAQTALGPVDVWVIGLGTNDVSLSTTDFETAVNTLLDDVAAAGGGFVLWVNLAFYNVANTNAATFNPVLATVAAARPSEMRVLDFNTYIHGGGVYDAADWIYPIDSTHMTVQGWAKRDAYIKAAVLEQIHSYEVAGTNAAVSGVTGNMSLPTANYAAAGTVAATTAVTGAVTVNGGVSGTVAGTTTVTGNAVRARSAAGTCAVATTVTGTVAVRSPAAGSVAAVTTVTSPTLALGAAVAGQCAAITAASGTVGLDIPISGTVAAEAAAVPGDTIADLQAAGAVAVLVELVGSPTITPRDLVIVTVAEVPNRSAVFVEVPERSATFEEV